MVSGATRRRWVEVTPRLRVRRTQSKRHDDAGLSVGLSVIVMVTIPCDPDFLLVVVASLALCVCVCVCVCFLLCVCVCVCYRSVCVFECRDPLLPRVVVLGAPVMSPPQHSFLLCFGLCQRLDFPVVFLCVCVCVWLCNLCVFLCVMDDIYLCDGFVSKIFAVFIYGPDF